MTSYDIIKDQFLNSTDFVTNNYNYTIKNFKEVIEEGDLNDVTIFTSESTVEELIKEKEKNSKDLSNDDILMCKIYGNLFKKEKEKLEKKNNSTNNIKQSRLYLSPLYTYIGNMKKNKGNDKFNETSRDEYTKNKKKLKENLNGLEQTIGWPKINIDQYFYGNPRNLLEQYFNLYMAYRIIDYEETFDKFFKLLNFLNNDSETEIVINDYDYTFKDSDKGDLKKVLDELYPTIFDFEKKVDINIFKKTIYDRLENVYMIPVSNNWIEFKDKLKDDKPREKIFKFIFLEFGVPIRTEKEINSKLEEPSKEYGTLDYKPVGWCPYKIETELNPDGSDIGNDKLKGKIIDYFEKNRRGYINWLVKVKLRKSPGFMQCFTNFFDKSNSVNYDNIDDIKKNFFYKNPNTPDHNVNPYQFQNASINNYYTHYINNLNKKKSWCLIPDRTFSKSLNMYNNRIIDMMGGGIRTGWMFQDDDYNQTAKKIDVDTIPFNMDNFFSEYNIDVDVGVQKKLNIDHINLFDKIIENVFNNNMFDKSLYDHKIFELLNSANEKEKEFQLRKICKEVNNFDLTVSLNYQDNIKNLIKNKNDYKYQICNNGLCGRLYFPKLSILDNDKFELTENDKKYDILNFYRTRGAILKNNNLEEYTKNESSKCYIKSFYGGGQIIACNNNIGYCFNVGKLDKNKQFYSYQDKFKISNFKENSNTNIFGNNNVINKIEKLYIDNIEENDDRNNNLNNNLISLDASSNNIINLLSENINGEENNNSLSYLGISNTLYNSLYDDNTYMARRRLGNGSAISNFTPMQYNNSSPYDFTMSYIHVYNNEKKIEAPYIFKEDDKHYIIPYNNINNLDGIMFNTTNFFTVVQTARTPTNSDYFNYNINQSDLHVFGDDQIKDIEDILYIGNENYLKLISNNIIDKLNLGGKLFLSEELDKQILLGSLTNNYPSDMIINLSYQLPTYPFFIYFNNDNDDVFDSDKNEQLYKIKSNIVQDTNSKIVERSNHPSNTQFNLLHPNLTDTTTIQLNSNEKLFYLEDLYPYIKNDDSQNIVTSMQYIKLLKLVFSGVSYQSQMSFFNKKKDSKLVDSILQSNFVAQGYNTTDFYSSNAPIIGYYINGDKINKKLKDNDNKSTIFDFSVGTKMLSLVLGCLINNADRDRLPLCSYYPINYTIDFKNIIKDGTNKVTNLQIDDKMCFYNYDEINMTSCGQSIYNFNKALDLLSRPYSVTLLPQTYMMNSDSGIFTYYQSSNIFNFKHYNKKKPVDNYKILGNSTMYDSGKSLLPFGGYYNYLKSINEDDESKVEKEIKKSINDVLIEEDLEDKIKKNKLMPENIWQTQNGSVVETEDNIKLGIFKHSLLNNIITDNYNVLNPANNANMKNMAELIVYISTLGVMLSWLSIYHYTTKGDYKSVIGIDSDDCIEDYKFTYNKNVKLSIFSMNTEEINTEFKIKPRKIDKNNIDKLNKELIKNICEKEDIKNEEFDKFKFLLNYNYGGALTFIHHEKISKKINDTLIGSKLEYPYVTKDSKYTWRAPSLLYYEDQFNSSFYNIINEEGDIQEKGKLLEKNFEDIDNNKLKNYLYYLSPQLYYKNNNVVFNYNEYNDAKEEILSGVNKEQYENKDNIKDLFNKDELSKLRLYHSIKNYGGVNNIQYFLNNNNKTNYTFDKIQNDYEKLYRKINENHKYYLKHSEHRANSMLDYWRKLKILPMYVDGLDFNKNMNMCGTILYNEINSHAEINKSGLRNIGGDNGLITVGSANIKLSKDKYNNLTKTSEKIVQKILIKMGVNGSIRNYFNKEFNGKYIKIDDKKLEELQDTDNLKLENFNVNENIKDENYDFKKPLKFYNNIKNNNNDYGLFHNDAVKLSDDEKKIEEIIGGTLLSFENIEKYVGNATNILKNIYLEDSNNYINNFKKDYLRSLYKIHQILFEVPLMKYNEESYKDIPLYDNFEKINKMMSSINTNNLTIYQKNEKKAKTDYKYYEGNIIPDFTYENNESEFDFIENNYFKDGKTIKKKRVNKEELDYMCLFGIEKGGFCQKITIAHQNEFIDAFSCMINRSSTKYYMDNAPINNDLLNRLAYKNEILLKLGLEDFNEQEIKFNKKGKHFPKIDINEFFRNYYILQDENKSTNNNIFSLDDYIKHHLNISGSSVLTFNNKYNTDASEYLINNMGLYKIDKIEELNNNLKYIKEEHSKSILEINEDIILGCGLKNLSRVDKKNDVNKELLKYYEELYNKYKDLFDNNKSKLNKVLFGNISNGLKETKYKMLYESFEKLQTKIHDQLKEIAYEALNSSNVNSRSKIDESFQTFFKDELNKDLYVSNIIKSKKEKSTLSGGGLSTEEIKIKILKITNNILYENDEIKELKNKMNQYNNDLEYFKKNQQNIILNIKKYLELRKRSTDSNLYYKEIQNNIFKQDELLIKMKKIINKYKFTIEKILQDIIFKLLLVGSKSYNNYITSLRLQYPDLNSLEIENNHIIRNYKLQLLGTLELNENIFSEIIKYIKKNVSNEEIKFKGLMNDNIITNYFNNENNSQNNYYGCYLNHNLYCNPDPNNYLCNNNNKNKSGVWVILKSTTYPILDKKELEKNIVYSLFDIITGRVIYCIGGIVRDKLYYKYNVNSEEKSFYKKIKDLKKSLGDAIFGDIKKKFRFDNMFYKIPEICSINDISGPILSIHDPYIEGNNLYYIQLNMDNERIFYRNNMLYFTPFSPTYLDYSNKRGYKINLDIMNETDSYLWYWNVLGLYNYINQNNLSIQDIAIIFDKFKKEYLTIEGSKLASYLEKDCILNINRNLIDLYISPKIELNEPGMVKYNKLFKFKDLPTGQVTSVSKKNNSNFNNIKLILGNKITLYDKYKRRTPIKEITDDNKIIDNNELKKKFIENTKENEKIEENISNICEISKSYDILNYNDNLSIFKKYQEFEYKDNKYDDIESCILINRITDHNLKTHIYQIYKNTEINLENTFKFMKMKRFINDDLYDDYEDILKNIYKDRFKIIKDGNISTYLRLILYCSELYKNKKKEDYIITVDENEVFKQYKLFLFEIIMNNSIKDFNIELLNTLDKYIKNYLNNPYNIKNKIKDLYENYIIKNKNQSKIKNESISMVNKDLEIIDKLIINDNDGNYYGKFLVILRALYIYVKQKTITGGGLFSPNKKINKNDRNTSKISIIYSKIHKLEYWEFNEININNLFIKVKEELKKNRDYISNIIIDEKCIKLSPFEKCRIPRLFNDYDYNNVSSSVNPNVNNDVYILGYETSSTKLTLDNLIVERYKEKYKVYYEMNNTIKNIFGDLKKMVNEKNNKIKLKLKNSDELKYITAKYKSVFELNYFKFLGRSLLKQLIELTESAKKEFKIYFDSDIQFKNVLENKRLINECMNNNEKMIYGNNKKLNSYGYLNSMYVGVLVNIWGGNHLFNYPIRLLIESNNSEKYILPYIVKSTWFINDGTNSNKKIKQNLINELKLETLNQEYYIKSWYYPGYNNYYLYYSEDSIAARLICGSKLVLETSNYIKEKKIKTGVYSYGIGKILFNKNRIRYNESSINRLTKEEFKKIANKKGGFKKVIYKKNKKNLSLNDESYKDYEYYKKYLLSNKYINNLNKNEKIYKINLYKITKNNDIKNVEKIEKSIKKYDNNKKKINMIFKEK